ncbi:MAG: hydrogenase maturation protease [Fervidicoccaceae archaeon]
MRTAFIICLGNPLRGDDAFGLLVFRLLRRLRLPVVYMGTAPENIVNILSRAKPELVIIVDALIEGGDGLIVSRLSNESDNTFVSTHSLSLKLLFRLAGLEPENIIVVGAKAENLSVGDRPSERIRKLAVEAASFIARLLII